MRRTKIVATIGPATSSEEQLERLFEAGVDVARINFSHGDHEEDAELVQKIRSVSEDVAVMADTKGPEVRLREVEPGVILNEAAEVELVTDEVEGDEETLSVNYEGFLDNISVGDTILIDDGKLELKVEELDDEVATCRVVHGGEVISRKSVTVPGEDIGLQAPTKKDVEDIKFAAKQGFDFVSLSFVKEASDVREARNLLESIDPEIDIISKIEHPRAMENLDEIIEVSDAVMVARGDLGVEMPTSRLPIMQKEIIEKCNSQSKPVITATHMLESMTENPTATRAETSDIANAVFDGTDAVMLSGETAVGDYPVEAVSHMSEVVESVEESMRGNIHHTVRQASETVADSISKNVWQASGDVGARHIVAHTSSGSTARNIAKYRPDVPIIAFTDSRKVHCQLNLVWGVTPIHTEFPESVEEMVQNSISELQKRGMVEAGDQLVMSAGIPTSVSGTTNMMQVRTVGQN